MAKLEKIVEYLDKELELAGCSDTSLNGLQVEGAKEVTKVALAVDSGLGIIQGAVARGAQLLFCHHGFLWEKPQRIVGPNKQLLELAFKAGLSLYGVHLPLDSHQTLGNNFVLARMLGLENLRPAVPYRNQQIGCVGKNSDLRTLKDLANRLAELPGAAAPLILGFGPEVPNNVCVVTGSGADALTAFEIEGFDTLISGEPKQFAYHYARDHKLNAVFAGHYATETVGVKAVGEVLTRKFGLDCFFLDHPTGI